MNPLSLRLLNQQLIAPEFSLPEELVSHFGAVQAQEYRLMRWAVIMRTKNPSAKAFKTAFDNGTIVRQHLMRGTWQLIAAEDYRWMMDLFSGRAAKVIKGWMAANSISIPDDELFRIRDIILRTVSDGKSVTREEIEDALLRRDVVMDSHRLSYHIRFAELEGLVCSGELLPMKATYSLVEEKMPKASRLEKISKDEALKKLCHKYFLSRGAATLEDFAWWTGLSKTDVLRGVSLLGDELHTESFQGREFYVSNQSRTKGFRTGRYLLIPSYDEYLISYKSRDIMLPPEFRHRAHNNSGNFNPIFAKDGVVCGNWGPFSSDGRFDFFVPGNQDAPELQKAWKAYLKAFSNE